MVPAAAVPVNPRVSSVELTRVTVAKVKPVVPTPTVKSLVAIPVLKSTPVTVIDGLPAPAAIIELLAIVLAGAGTPMLIVLLASAGGTAKADVFAWTVIVPAEAVPLKKRVMAVELS